MAGVKARLWNKGTVDFKGIVQDKEYKIKAGGFITMGLDEAVLVSGNYPGKGVPWPLRVERLGLDGAHPEFRCPKDGERFASKKELDEHIKTHADESLAPEEGKDEEKKPVEVFVCPTCFKKIGTLHHMKLHMKAHKGVTANDTESSVPDSDGPVQ